MNVGERLNSLNTYTVIHIQSLEHWELLTPCINLDYETYKNDVRKGTFCICKKSKDYTWCTLQYYRSHKNYYNIISSNEIIGNIIHEVW